MQQVPSNARATREAKITEVTADGFRKTWAQGAMPDPTAGTVSVVGPGGVKGSLNIRKFDASHYTADTVALAKEAHDDLIAFCRQGEDNPVTGAPGARNSGTRFLCDEGFVAATDGNGRVSYAPQGVVTMAPAIRKAATIGVARLVASKKAMGLTLDQVAAAIKALGIAVSDDELLAAYGE